MDDGRSDLLEAGWGEQPVGIAQLTGIVRRQFGLVLLAFVVSVSGGAAYIVLSDPLYTASASIYAETQAAQTDATTQMQLDTHVELIKSDGMISAVIDELGLDEVFDTEPGVLQRTVSDVRRWLELEILDVSNESDEGSEMIRRVKSGLSVERVGNTAIIDISYDSESKALSVAVADAFANLYVARATARTEQSFAQRVHRLQERAEEVQRRVSSADESIRHMRSQNNFAVSDADDLKRQLTDLRQRLSAANGEEAVLRTRLALISDVEDVKTLQTAALQTPASVEIYNGLVTALDKLEQMRQQTGVPEATITQLERAVAEMREALQRELRRARDGLELDLAIVAAQRASAQSELKAIEEYAGSTAWSDLLQVERESLVYEEFYRGYLSDLESAYRQRPSLDVRLISNARSPLNPSSPNYKVVLTLAGMIGLVIGGGIALYREWNAAAADGRPRETAGAAPAAGLPPGSLTRY
jgi:succinoglycan biosynthesis transport protein ExoP